MSPPQKMPRTKIAEKRVTTTDSPADREVYELGSGPITTFSGHHLDGSVNRPFDPKRMQVALTKTLEKSMSTTQETEREKSPVSRNTIEKPEEREKSPGCTTHDRRHALVGGLSLTGAPPEDMEMETDPSPACNDATPGNEENTKQPCDMPGGSSLPQDVALPQARSSLVWGLLESLRRDPNSNIYDSGQARYDNWVVSYPDPTIRSCGWITSPLRF